jgi:hypothetical protein
MMIGGREDEVFRWTETLAMIDVKALEVEVLNGKHNPRKASAMLDCNHLLAVHA